MELLIVSALPKTEFDATSLKRLRRLFALELIIYQCLFYEIFRILVKNITTIPSGIS